MNENWFDAMKQSWKKGLAFFVFAGVIFLAGLFLDNYFYQQQLTFIGIFTLLAVGLNMLMGYAGQISLGHAAFYGIGAYTTGALTVHLGWSPWASLPCALAASGIIAYIVGKPTLKLSGYYLGMGTLGFGMIMHVLFREWGSITGGPNGLVGIPSLSLWGIDLSTGRNYLWVVWGCVLITFFICDRLVNSRVGRALRAIHFSEQAASAVGVDTAKAKLQVFVFSAMVAALAGFLYAHLVMFISPGSFGFLVSVKLVAMVVIGGMASIWGALLGSTLLTMLPEWLHAFSDYEMVIYGGILMGVMIFLPQGLTRGVLDIYEKFRIERKQPAKD
ncbi:inner-membrane translocator [Desulfatibacillum aliphaticivorans]|uniref:Inner-membrane translocator n=2 Tax=Desulfatibacillum aliphaticivorans TaxID=218208 RepID=B8FEK0_DESAL|nr:inner-membrane translocator [Desulfatibacillum aliphaticivorans]